MTSWRVAAPTRTGVGEGPLWNEADNSIYWVDITGPSVYRLNLSSNQLDQWTMPETIGFIVKRSQSRGFAVGLRSGIYSIDFSPFRLELIAALEPKEPPVRVNDGKVDGCGRLWFGTASLTGIEPVGCLYRMDADLTCRTLDSNYLITNGPSFNVAQNVLYHADSPRRIVYRFDLSRGGELSDKRTHIVFPDAWGLPDGMTIDSEDHLWVAHWGGGRISRFNPMGKLVRVIDLPVSRVTSVTFAGPTLERLFVTSAAEDRDDEPHAGALFEVSAGVPGVRSHDFNG